MTVKHYSELLSAEAERVVEEKSYTQEDFDVVKAIEFPKVITQSLD